MTGVTLAGIGDEAGRGIEEQVRAVESLGWRAIELRTVDGVALAELDDAAFDRVAGVLAEHGISTVCADSRIGDWSSTITSDLARDVAELATLARRCGVLGTRHVRVMSYPNAGLPEDEWGRLAVGRLRELARRAEQAGLVLLHENCSGWAGRSAERAATLVAEVDSPAFALLHDTGNGVAHGYSGYHVLASVAEHVAHVHVKDAVPTPDGVRYTLPGEGAARVADSVRLLLRYGYQGAFSVEPHLGLRPHERSGRGTTAGFVAAGRALESLLDDYRADAAAGSH